MYIEYWCAIPGYEGEYEVSDLGRVRSLERRIWRESRGAWFSQRVPARVLRPGKAGSYGHVSVSLRRHNSRLVHQLVLLAFVGPCPPGQEVRHKNCNGGDNRLANLHYGTRAQNNVDSSKAGKRKLDPACVRRIRAIPPSESNARLVAAQFGVSRSTAWDVWYGHTWRHV